MYWHNLHRHEHHKRQRHRQRQRLINAWGCSENDEKRRACGRKNSHPSFALTKRHLWRRDEKFFLIPQRLLARCFIFFYFFFWKALVLAFKAFSGSPRTLLFCYSTTIIPPLHSSLSAQYLSFSPLCVAIAARGIRGWFL